MEDGGEEKNRGVGRFGFNLYNFGEARCLTNSQISLSKGAGNTGPTVGADTPNMQYILKL